jgi:hypothetical protein
MALLNGSGTDATSSAAPRSQATSQVDSSDKKAAFKAKKLEALKRFKERRTERAKKAYEDALKLRDELVKAAIFDKLSKEAKEFIISLCHNPAERRVATGFGGPSVFTVLYGDKPTVGQSITLQEAFNKTFKGKSTLDVWVKRWAEKGIIVECEVDPSNMLASKYTIKALPSA